MKKVAQLRLEREPRLRKRRCVKERYASILFSSLYLTVLQRAVTHDDKGKRTRYYADDDVDLQTLVEREVQCNNIPRQ